MLARNSLLARLAASAASFARCSSSATWFFCTARTATNAKTCASSRISRTRERVVRRPLERADLDAGLLFVQLLDRAEIVAHPVEGRDAVARSVSVASLFEPSRIALITRSRTARYARQSSVKRSAACRADGAEVRWMCRAMIPATWAAAAGDWSACST